MAQGKLKVKAKLPEGAKTKGKKGSATSKRKNQPIQPKKGKFEEAHKLKQIITKTVNKTIESEVRAMAGNDTLKLSKAQQAVAQHHTNST